MKKVILIFAMVLSSLIVASAQESNQNSRPMQRQGQFDPEQAAKMRTEQMTKQLNLTTDQQTKVHEIMLKEMQDHKRPEMKQGERPSQEQMQQQREQMQQRRAETNKQIKAVLTAEQYKKYEQMDAQQHSHRQQGQRGEGHGDRQGRGRNAE